MDTYANYSTVLSKIQDITLYQYRRDLEPLPVQKIVKSSNKIGSILLTGIIRDIGRHAMFLSAWSGGIGRSRNFNDP